MKKKQKNCFCSFYSVVVVLAEEERTMKIVVEWSFDVVLVVVVL